MQVIAAAFPGQSESVRIGLGRIVWLMLEGAEYPRSDIYTGGDTLPEETHSPREFLQSFPPKKGGIVEAEASQRDLF